MRVLVVEDHAKLAMTMATGLRQAGMAVDVVFDGHDALAHLAVTVYDVVVLDRDIPGVHGDDVCKALLEEGSPSRVLMLTAAGAVQDRVEGLGIGADDYLAKPCDFSELVARIRALVRRPGTSLPPTLVHGEVVLDPSLRVATRGGRPLSLNPKEVAVLELLLAAQGAVVSAEEMLERVWDEAADPFSQAVRTTISRLRAKMGDPAVIETVPRVGYRIGGYPVSLQSRLTNLAFRPHLPRRTVRMRLTLLYGCLFLASGAGLLAITYVLVDNRLSGPVTSGGSRYGTAPLQGSLPPTARQGAVSKPSRQPTFTSFSSSRGSPSPS